MQLSSMATTSSPHFATSRRMGINDPLHQISMWEDVFEGNISPNTGASTTSPMDARIIDNKSEHTSNESLGASPDNNQATRNISDKLQRRLAQNREAARKSRLRKKAYIQQLETGRMKLTQLEQELEKARQQGVYGGALNMGNALLGGGVHPGIAAFEIEYDMWVSEQQKKDGELRNVLQAYISDAELQIYVESGFSHYYDLFRMKGDAAKADVFYLISGLWRTPVERFFLWIGGFRPSELLTILIPQLEPLTEQQQMSVCSLRYSCQQAEDAVSQGMDKLQQTLAQSITSEITGAGNYSCEMASAMEMIEALENFVNQADHLRQQTLQQLCRVLTTRQAARGLLALGDYFQRLRALSSLWPARPRDATN